MFPMMKLVLLLLAALLPAIANGQFSYTVKNNAVTITGYTGAPKRRAAAFQNRTKTGRARRPGLLRPLP